ncbi:hypothetical protein MM808_33555, partial [Klebsiella pneumoniae]|nr:hypothetical protein [Klebsiella pneumoniae]
FGKQQNWLGVVYRHFCPYVFREIRQGNAVGRAVNGFGRHFYLCRKALKYVFKTLCYVSPYRMRD